MALPGCTPNNSGGEARSRRLEEGTYLGEATPTPFPFIFSFPFVFVLRSGKIFLCESRNKRFSHVAHAPEAAEQDYQHRVGVQQTLVSGQVVEIGVSGGDGEHERPELLLNGGGTHSFVGPGGSKEASKRAIDKKVFVGCAHGTSATNYPSTQYDPSV